MILNKQAIPINEAKAQRAELEVAKALTALFGQVKHPTQADVSQCLEAIAKRYLSDRVTIDVIEVDGADLSVSVGYCVTAPVASVRWTTT